MGVGVGVVEDRKEEAGQSSLLTPHNPGELVVPLNPKLPKTSHGRRETSDVPQSFASGPSSFGPCRTLYRRLTFQVAN